VQDPGLLEWRHLVLRMHNLTGQWLLAFDSDSPDSYEVRDESLRPSEQIQRSNALISDTAFEMARRFEGKAAGVLNSLNPAERVD
jgi:hypothetical protein